MFRIWSSWWRYHRRVYGLTRIRELLISGIWIWMRSICRWILSRILRWWILKRFIKVLRLSWDIRIIGLDNYCLRSS